MDREVRAGKRVFIREPRGADMELFLHAVKKSRKLHRPWVAPPDRPAKFHKYLARAKKGQSRPYLVCRRTDGALAGVVNLNEIVMGSLRSAYLGYYVFAGFDRKGLLREGMELVLGRAFGNLKLHRLEANIQPGNKRSIGLVKRIGFRKEGFSPRYLKVLGRWRDHERWAITVEDWKAKRGGR